MKQDSAKIILALNRLVETCKDGQDGFRNAAQRAPSPDLQRLLSSYAGQRATFAAELQAEVRRQGGDPEKSGTVLGTLQRGWMNLKASVLGESDETILEECEQGEDAAIQNYEEVAREVLPPDIQELVARQYKEIKDAHGRIRELRNSAARASGSQEGGLP